MSSKESPFAALTGAQKQLKWLEVQSVRLPYVEGALEKARRAPPPDQPPAPTPAPAPPKPQAAPPPRADFQRTRHRQYDAVVTRMLQAEKRLAARQPLA